MEFGRKLFFAVLALFTLGATVHADDPAPTRQQVNYEVRFLTGMIDHHAMAVEMARLCDGRTVHQELSDLCDQIEAAQTQEIDLMQGWLQDWYGIAYEPQMTQGGMQMLDRLAATSGAEFEIMFMETMIRHHAAAVREARHCQRMAYHQDLIDLCEQIEAAQLPEIATMTQWLADWYGTYLQS